MAALSSKWLGYSQALVAERYPVAENGAIRLSVDAGRKVTASAGRRPGKEEHVTLWLPVTVEASDPADAAFLDAVQATVRAPGGEVWTSRWEGSGVPLRPGDSERAIGLSIGEPFLEKVKKESVELDLRLATTQLRAAGTTQVAMAAQDFAVPGFGMCVPIPDFATPSFTGITCRAALREPPPTWVQVQWSDEACRSGAAENGVEGVGWSGGVSADPADLNLAAVWSSQVRLSSEFEEQPPNQPERGHRRYLCPGSPMKFTRYALVRRAQMRMTVTNFHVPDWNPPAESGASIGVRVP